MRAILVCCGLFCGAAVAQAQYAMPGGVQVGRPMINPVGNQFEKVGAQFPKVGKPAGFYGANGQFTTEKPVQPAVDLKNVVAPYPGMPGEGKDFWDRLYDRSTKFMGIDQPKIVQQNWTPGLSRRNRERREDAMNFRRD